MANRIGISHIELVVENLHILANGYRDQGKYVKAGARYRQAIAILGGIEPGDRKHSILAKILEDEATMLRKMKCGNVAAVIERYAEVVRSK
jgi:hypothetical protein